MSTTNEQATARNVMWRRTAYGIGFVALAFSVIVCGLLVVDATSAEQISTVRSPALQETLALARQTPGNAATVTLARDMDRLARHAYFSSVTFRQVGLWMLAIGLVAGLFSLHLAGRLAQRVKDPRLASASDPLHADRRARLAMLASGAAVLMLVAVWQAGTTGCCCTSGKPVCYAAPISNAAPAVVVMKEPASKPAPVAVLVAPVVAPVAEPAPTVVSNVAPIVVTPPLKAVEENCWGCFRGPKQGVSPWTNAPSEWDGASGKGILWKTPLKVYSVASPVVCGNKVYIVDADEKERTVSAFDATTGKMLWRQVVADGGKGENMPQPSGDTGFGAPTPVCDANGVYAVFGTGDLVAFSPDGKKKWQIYLHRPDISYGYSSSLGIADGKVFVQYDVQNNGRVLAVNTADGKIAWETARQAGSWSSPMIIPGANGKPLFVVNAMNTISAYELATGKKGWEVDGVSGEVAPSPAYADGRIYAVNGGSRLVCYKVSEKPEQLWEYSENLADIASPVVVNGLLFMANSGGTLVCVDAVTGKEVWNHEAPGCYASLVASGDHVYVLGRDGKASTVAAERTFRQIAECVLGDETDSTPAMSDGRIYIRGKENLWCIGAK
jgi:outer membrane protein assembly factor BamB